MKNTKTIKKLITIILTLTLILGCIYIPTTAVEEDNISTAEQVSEITNPLDEATESDNIIIDKSEYKIEDVSKELFGEINVKKSEFLYNLDGSSDYIYVEFREGGYAVFLKQTMELMEYSPTGTIDYNDSAAKKYYAGPGNYYLKSGTNFINTMTEEVVSVSEEKAVEFSNRIRSNLMLNYETKVKEQNAAFDYTLTDESLNNTEANGSRATESADTSSAPGYNDYLPITVVQNATYIPNANYFLTSPKHGNNSTGTCYAVAAQLLLSYHNYYSDRRIIADNYLNGGSDNPEANPNLCSDPGLMTIATLGTRGYEEDGSDDPNSYFAYVLSQFTDSDMDGTISAFQTILNARNINYSIVSDRGSLFFLNPTPVNPNGIVSEIASGQPLYISLQDELGAGIDHGCIVYGYANYKYPNTSTEYLGFIAHMGWDENSTGNKIHVWVNSAWCYGYISLNINHEHNYSTIGEIETRGRIEYKCDTCGQRTDYHVSLNNANHNFEATCDISKANYKDYGIEFVRGGLKLIQTFGTQKVKLYLYDLNYNILATDTNYSGYNNNALINYTVQANQKCILRIVLEDCSGGKVKFNITSPTTTGVNFESIYNVMGTSAHYESNVVPFTACVMSFTPTIDGIYSFEASHDSLVMLYVFDARSTTVSLYDFAFETNEPASVSKYLYSDRTYFLIASPSFLLNGTGTITIDITKN